MILAVDPSAGLSGDMLVAALIDLGLPISHVRRALDSFGLEGVKVRALSLSRGGIRARRWIVSQESNSFGLPREVFALMEFVRGSRSPAPLRRKVLRVLRVLADAEASVHRLHWKRVCFHQLAGVDTLANIAGFCAGLLHFRIDRMTTCAPIPLGCRHQDHRGVSRPTPGPATQRLLSGFSIEYRKDAFEWTTPTAAALLKAFALPGGFPPFRVTAIGCGAGHAAAPSGASVSRLLLGNVTYA